MFLRCLIARSEQIKLRFCGARFEFSLKVKVTQMTEIPINFYQVTRFDRLQTSRVLFCQRN